MFFKLLHQIPGLNKADTEIYWNPEIDQNPATESLHSEKLCNLRQLLPFGKLTAETLKQG